jgi:hypothetical protein
VSSLENATFAPEDKFFFPDFLSSEMIKGIFSRMPYQGETRSSEEFRLTSSLEQMKVGSLYLKITKIKKLPN